LHLTSQVNIVLGALNQALREEGYENESVYQQFPEELMILESKKI
jgi:hypothetical protein